MRLPETYARRMQELLGQEYHISSKEVLEDVQEVLDFLKKNEAMTW